MRAKLMALIILGSFAGGVLAIPVAMRSSPNTPMVTAAEVADSATEKRALTLAGAQCPVGLGNALPAPVAYVGSKMLGCFTKLAFWSDASRLPSFAGCRPN